MRIVHTADWHLGHTLRDQPRTEEHRAFLGWLLRTLQEVEADALLVAGDVFETANPPASALSMFYRFLADARGLCPELDIVVIAGNHDSAARLDAPQPLLDGLDVRVVGALPRDADGQLDLDAMTTPLRGRDGSVAAWAVAAPYLRPADLPRGAGPGDPLVAGVREIYEQLTAHAESLRDPGQALVGLGHCYMAHTRSSEDSERKILGGHQHGLPADVFPPALAYVALGNLHQPQQVDERVRYSGSPIPLSLAEEGYGHQVLVVDLAGPTLSRVEPRHVPREVDLLRLPEGPLPEVLERLAGLAAHDEVPERWRHPFLEVTVRLDAPEPTLRAQVEAALEDRAARLVRLNVVRTDVGDALASVEEPTLSDLTPEEVFLRRWAREYSGDPPAELLAAFHQLTDELDG